MKKNNQNLKPEIETSIFYFLFSKFSAVLLLSTFYFLFSGSAFAAELKLISQNKDIAVNQEFQVDLLLDSEGEEINALEARIVFPADLLELKEIQDGNSIINFWVEKPREGQGEIIFSGIIPGGFNGVLIPDSEKRQSGKILSLLFRAKKEGEGIIEINNSKALLNDGNGTAALLKATNYTVSFSKKDFIPDILFPQIIDFEKPESFNPEISKDPNIFDGKWFLVFAAQDKGSGIDRYEIQENRRQKIENRKWETAESPYLLKDQKLKSNIYVKAVDFAGNERIEIIPARYPYIPWYKNYWIWGIIIVGFIVIYIIVTRIKRHGTRK